MEVKLPKLGESIKEARLLNCLKSVGEYVEKDEAIAEFATDKVDTEVVAPSNGVITAWLIEPDDVVTIGTVIAKIESNEASDDAEIEVTDSSISSNSEDDSENEPIAISKETQRFDDEGRFYSPLVRSIAAAEGVSFETLKTIPGSGNNGRLLKKDIQNYLAGGNHTQIKSAPTINEGRTEIIEMDRMRSMIAEHMVHSKHTSPHVTSYVEADVTELVKWREKNKDAFFAKHGQKITFTPFFVEAVVEALKEFPLINVSVDGNKIIVKKDIHIGLATALPNGNLIVPVIRHANQQNLLGLTSSVNTLVEKARTNKLSPDEVQGSTFTISNVGTFRNIMGTPIINQPEVAILATGAIRKRPAVVETEYGDVIAVRHMMYLSLSYDHRVVDGNLGGSFLARIGDHLEAFDKNRGLA